MSPKKKPNKIFFLKTNALQMLYHFPHLSPDLIIQPTKNCLGGRVQNQNHSLLRKCDTKAWHVYVLSGPFKNWT